MAKKGMSFSTINTILNTAPIIIQGATRLIKLIRDEGEDEKEEIPETIEGIKNELKRVNQRFDANTQSDLEQIKLIEELAKQNESMAAQLKSTMAQLNRITVVAIVAIMLALLALVL